MRKSRSKRQKVTPNLERVQVNGEALEINVSADQLLGEVAVEIEAFSAQIGLRIMHAVMEQEVDKMLGPWAGRAPGVTAVNGAMWSMEGARLAWSVRGCEGKKAERSAWILIGPFRGRIRCRGRWRDN